MRRFQIIRTLTFVALGLSVQFCGSDNGGGSGQTPNGDYPTYAAADYQAATGAVETAETALNQHGLKFAATNGKVQWDREAILQVLSEHPACGMEERLPALTAYQKVLSDFVAKFGRGVFVVDGGSKKLVKADEDPIRADRAKLDIVNKTIETVKKDSLRNGEPCNDDSGNAPVSPDAPANTDRAAPPQPPTEGHPPPSTHGS